MPRGYRIAGGILDGVSAYYFFSAAVAEDLTVFTDSEQESLRSAWLVVGTACAAAATIVVVKGHFTARVAPSMTHGGFTVRGAVAWGGQGARR